MFGQKQTDDWKTKYREIVAELETKERQWGALESALRRAVSQVAIAGMGQTAGLDEHLTEVSNLCRSGVDAAELGRALQRLASVVKHVEREFGSTQTIIERTLAEKTQDFSRVFLQLAERIAAISPLADAAREWERLVKRSRGPADLGPLVTDLADRIAAIVTAMQAQRAELEVFVEQIGEQLQSLEDFARWQRGAAEERKSDAVGLERNVQHEMQGLHADVAASPSLAELKLKVQLRLDAVARELQEFRDTEERRFAEAERRNAVLATEIGALRDKQDALKKVVGAQHVRLMQDTVWDIDHFKVINDAYGHQAGDRLLRLAAGILNQHKRADDFLARLGGEEFVLLLPATTADAALVIAEQLRELIATTPFNHHGKPERVTISCGVTELRAGDTPDSVFERADRALYRAKAEGRNRCIKL
jgi:diguanylate cyclase